MKKSGERLLLVVSLVMLFMTCGGILSIVLVKIAHTRRFHRDLLADETLTLEFIGPETVEVQEPRAAARGDTLVIVGCLHRKAPLAEPPTAQIDVTLLSAHGDLLHQTTIHDFPRCKQGGEHFSTRFPAIPSDGSVLRIKWYAGREEDSTLDIASSSPGG